MTAGSSVSRFSAAMSATTVLAWKVSVSARPSCQTLTSSQVRLSSAKPARIAVSSQTAASSIG